MQTARSRLLIMLVLLVGISAAAWTTADARPRTWYRSGYVGHRSSSGSAVTVGARSGIRPMSGEPDSSTPTKSMPTITGLTGLAVEGDDDGQLGGSLSGIITVWMARFLLGVR